MRVGHAPAHSILRAWEAALDTGRAAGLRPDELAPGIRRLEELQRREEARQALEEAMRPEGARNAMLLPF